MQLNFCSFFINFTKTLIIMAKGSKRDLTLPEILYFTEEMSKNFDFFFTYPSQNFEGSLKKVLSLKRK